MSASRGRVILYQPLVERPNGPASFRHVPPLSYLALAGPLRQAGYDVRILDGKWEPRRREEITETVRDAVCLGVSCLTGYPVTDGLEIAALARRVRPDLPVVWGGWHASFVSRQAIRDERVDVVARGQAERSFPELLDALEAKRSLRTVPGVTFLDGDEVVETPTLPPEDINNFPPPAYDLIELDRYVRVGPGGSRHFDTLFSRGCPYQCDFCLDSRQQWLGLRIPRIEAELEFLVRHLGVDHVRLYDGNFFMGAERLREFARMILDGPLAGRFRWTATAVAKRVVQIDDDLWSLLRRSGCEQIALGGETGSEELLARITNKTTVEHTLEAVRVLTRHGINQYVFFMVGLPDEPEDALTDTLRLAARLKRINPRLQLQMSFCIPLPGSQLFRTAIERGLFQEPAQFADWGSFDYERPNLPHIDAGYEQMVRRFVRYLPLAYPDQSAGSWRHLQSGLAGWLWSPARRLARWRLEHNEFRLPLELRLVEASRSLRNMAMASHGPP